MVMLAVTIVMPLKAVSAGNSPEKVGGIVTCPCTCNGECKNHTTELLTHVEVATAPTANLIPSTFDISSSSNVYHKYLPPVKQQNGGSCVAYSLCYAQYSFEVNKMLNRTVGGTNTYYSPMLPYNILREDTIGKGGIKVNKTYNYLENHGDLLWQDFNPSGFTVFPTTSVGDKAKLRDALKIRSNPYYSLYIDGTGTPITGVNSVSVTRIKQRLSEGHVLRASSFFTWNAAGTNNSILYRCMMADQGHSIAIVGYDDTFYYDVNKNGVAESGEYGAFKIMNSWDNTYGINGYAMVMYDALNKVSSIPNNGENLYTGTTRMPAFAYNDGDNATSNHNWFTWIDVAQKDVCVVGELTYTAAHQNEMTVQLRNINSWIPTIYTNIGPESQRTTAILFDYNSFIDVKGRLDIGIDSRVNIIDNKAGTPISNISWRIIDSLGTELITPQTIPNTENTASSSNAAAVRFFIGDLNYDGTVNSSDASRILQYASGMVQFSCLQLYLGDYNLDGVVNTGDANALLSSLTQ